MEKNNGSESNKNIAEACHRNGDTQIDFGEDGWPDHKSYYDRKESDPEERWREGSLKEEKNIVKTFYIGIALQEGTFFKAELVKCL